MHSSENNSINNWLLTASNSVKHITRMSWINIKRHVMVKHSHSPFDKIKETYFNQCRKSRQ